MISPLLWPSRKFVVGNLNCILLTNKKIKLTYQFYYILFLNTFQRFGKHGFQVENSNHLWNYLDLGSIRCGGDAEVISICWYMHYEMYMHHAMGSLDHVVLLYILEACENWWIFHDKFKASLVLFIIDHNLLSISLVHKWAKVCSILFFWFYQHVLVIFVYLHSSHLFQWHWPSNEAMLKLKVGMYCGGLYNVKSSWMSGKI